VAELADARDSNSRVREDLWVRFPPPASENAQVDLEHFLSMLKFEGKEKAKKLSLGMENI
jgi:hypothetical protein